MSADIRPLVEKFVADLEAAFRKSTLSVIHDALGSMREEAAAAPKAAPAAPKAAAPAPAKRAKAAPAAPAAPAKAAAPSKKEKASGGRNRRSLAEIEQTANKILEHVRKNPGQRAEQIKDALKLDKAQWMVPLARLLEKGQIKRKGERRSTTYTAG
ncbi:MAG: hypothetical protein U0271_31125 [Polyangiaceae bacterium]